MSAREELIQNLKAARRRMKMHRPPPVVTIPDYIPVAHPKTETPRERKNRLLREKRAAKRAAIQKIVDREPHGVSVRTIQEAVCIYFDVPLNCFFSLRRTKVIARPRHVAMYLCKRWTRLSYPALGLKFGRDHTTVLHGATKIEAELKSDLELSEQISEIEEMLGLSDETIGGSE